MSKPVEITVISGKGGTGKTMLTSSLAVLLPDKVIADCDVDAPDLHLLLNPDIRKTEPFFGMKTASISPDLCTSCGRCAQVCRFGAVRAGEGDEPYGIDPMACEGCGVCMWNCPENAIAMCEAKGGEWYVSDTRAGRMVHACLGAAQENSGKLVSVVRQEARKAAEEEGAHLVIIDGPPGIGCPVIASVAGVDLAVVVTEPTLSGLHDLERTLQLTRHFGIRACCVINKYDLNPEMSKEIEKHLGLESIPLAGKIPFGREVTEAIAACKPVVEASGGDIARTIKEIGLVISSMIRNREDAGLSKSQGN
jgi:MinD superfamily P-loop ATPase